LASLIAEHRRVVVDLESCNFMDSVGLSVLVAAHKRALEQQVDLRFRLSPAARQVIDLTGLADWLTLEP
jgi:anti-anti-sigma factor